MSQREKVRLERWKLQLRPKHRAILHSICELCTKKRRDGGRTLVHNRSVSAQDVTKPLRPAFRRDAELGLDWLCWIGLVRWNPLRKGKIKYFFTPLGLRVWKLFEKERKGLLSACA